MNCPVPPNEDVRIRALESYFILDTPPESAYDDLVELAARICRTPMATISLLDSHRQWFKARTGVETRETPRDVAFCAHGIAQPEPLFIVPDAREDDRFAQSPLVLGEPHIRFYAGAQLATSEGHVLGMLCVMDREPRKLDDSQKESLRILARQVVAQLDLRRELIEHRASRERLREIADRHSLVVKNLKEVVFQTDADGLWTFLNPAWEEITGFSLEESLGKPFLNYVHPNDRERNQALFAPLIQRKKDHCRHEVRYLTKDGSHRWVEVFARLTLDANQNIMGTSGTLHDITQRKSAEDKLRESEALYHSLADHLPLFVLRKDAAGRFTFANKPLCEALQCPPDELPGKSDFDFLPADLAGKFRERDRRVSETGEVIETVETFSQRDGQTIYLQTITSALRDSKGDATGVQVVSRNVTERHQLELELRQAHDELEQRVHERTAQLEAANNSLAKAEQQAQEWKNRYDLIVASSGLAIYDIDYATAEVIWGNSTERVLGQPVDALNRAGDEFLQLVHPEDRSSVAVTIGRAVIAGSSYDTQYRFRHRAGHYLWIQDRGFILRDAQNRCIRVLGVMQDVTERKLAEDKMREQAALLDKTHDAIMVRDLENRVLYWNQTAERLYGWTAAEALGKPVHHLLLSGSLAHLPVARVAALKHAEWSGEVKVFTKAGKELTVHSRWALLRDHDGKPQAFLVAHTDLTERKLLEEKFFRAQRLENIGALASGIAHDLNNIFTPILLTSELLGNGLDASSRANMLDVLQTSARRGAEMVKQVLTFTRGIQGAVGNLQIRHLVREIEKMMRDTFPREISIRTGLSKNLLPVRGDATQLYQVFLNLCINARDAMPAGGVLAIEGKNVELTPEQSALHGGQPEPYNRITVSDSGTGIAPELQGKVFEPFFTTKELGKGTGLGLSTVKAIVEAHRGFIELSSQVGVGTRFEVYLPAEPAGVNEAAAVIEQAPDGHGELLLVVDDESAIREIVKSTLEAHGYDVLLAAEGAEALALYAMNREKIALVITDMVMPVMDGRTTIRALRKMNPDVKLIAVSGLMDPEALAQIAASTGTTVLPKPYSPQKLLTSIYEVLSVPSI